jgi:hypothetical protein
MAGQSVALISIPGKKKLIAFSAQSRKVTTTVSAAGKPTPVDPADIQLRNLDGSTEGLTVTGLRGDEDGTGSKWSDSRQRDDGTSATWSKSLFFGESVHGKKILLVLEIVQKRLDIYEVE